MKERKAAQTSRTLRAPRLVAVDIIPAAHACAISDSPEYVDRLDMLCVEWLVTRGLEGEIRQDHSGQAVEVARAG